jgi:hypothetical protein
MLVSGDWILREAANSAKTCAARHMQVAAAVRSRMGRVEHWSKDALARLADCEYG